MQFAYKGGKSSGKWKTKVVGHKKGTNPLVGRFLFYL